MAENPFIASSGPAIPLDFPFPLFGLRSFVPAAAFFFSPALRNMASRRMKAAWSADFDFLAGFNRWVHDRYGKKFLQGNGQQ